MSPIRFTSKIHFVRETPFETAAADKKRPTQFVSEYDNNRLTRDKNIETADRALTKSISMCSGGGVTNGKQVVMFHFQPWGATSHNVSRLEKAIRELKKSGGTLNGLLIGGHDSDPDSVNVMERVRRLFLWEGIPFSQFWGHRHEPRPPSKPHQRPPSWRSDLLYDAPTDTWTIRTFTEQGKNQWARSEVTDEASLTMAFKSVRIGPHDEISISDRV